MARNIIDDTRSPDLEPNPASELGIIDRAIHTVGTKGQKEFIDKQQRARRKRERNKEALANPVHTPGVEPTEPFQVVTQGETDKSITPDNPGFISQVSNEIDNGLGSNLFGLLQDFADQEPESEELFLELVDKAEQINEKFGWDSTITDELISEVQSVEELERKANRIFEQQGFMASLENASMAQQLAAGFTGFVLDPVNLIPGGILLKAGAATAKVLPRVASTLQRNKVNKTGTWAAVGAVEEAARNYPRLMNDPTYSYELYKLDVGLGAAFGGGLAAIPTAGRFAATKIHNGVNKALNKYKTSLEARLAVNTLTDTLGVTKNPQARAAVKAAVDAAAGPDIVKAAKKAADVERAQQQVNNSKVNKTLWETSQKVKAAIEEGSLDAQSIVAEFSSELKRTHPTFAKIADALAERVRRAANAEDTTPKSAGAAGRKETLGTKIGDKAHDLAQDHVAVKEALDDIDRAFELAQGVAKGVKDADVDMQLNALRSMAKRGVVEKAKIAGVKPKLTASTVEVNQAVYGKFKNYQKRINQLDFALNRILKEAGVTDRNIMSPVIGKSFKQAGVVGYKNFRDAVMKDPAVGHRVEVALEENLDRMIDDIYTQVPNADTALFEALENSAKAIRADVQWGRLVIKERSAAAIAMDPEWALISHEFQKSMGDDLSILDDIYNSTFNKVLRNQFGGFTRSYAGELAASRTPLAQWAALHIFELPGGTGGKIARNETAAISMEMFEAAATHPVNVAWDKAVRAEAKARGLGMLDSAVMRHSSAAADPNANALGRKVQLEMNARQMGRQTDASPHVKAYADELEKAYDRLYQTQYENGVEGITGLNKIKAYMNQSWAEARVIDAIDGDLGKEGFEQLVTKALRNRNNEATPGELKQQARAIIDRMEDNINNREGREPNNIVTDGDYINKRVLHMDLDTRITVHGQEYHLLDLMSNDVTSNLNKYAKKTAATSAISKASGGRLNSAEAISSFIHAVGQESQGLGTHVEVGDLTNAFKLMMGEPIKSFDPRARKIRDAVALSGMNGLGESQLAELGLAMNRGTAALFAANQVASRVAGKFRGKWRGLELTPEQAANTKLLEEMQSVSTLYEQMHNLARQNVHFDESYHGESTSATMSALNKVVDFGTGGKYRPVMQHVQTKHTGYGSIRTMQEQVSMAGLMHDVGRKLAGKKSTTSDARLADIGIPMDLLRKKLKDGSIQLDANGNITTLSIETWSKKEQHSLGVALRRHAAQQVQVGFAGEASALMSNPWVAFMMQFRSYPNIAAEKQQMRNALFHDKEAAMGLTLNSASSMAARVIRYQSLALALPEDKRERYLDNKYKNLAHDTALYMGGVGSMMNTYDMVQDPTKAIPPVFSWANNYRKAAAGLGNGISSRDVGNIATAVPLGTIAQMNLISGVIKDIMETDAEPVTQVTARNRGG